MPKRFRLYFRYNRDLLRQLPPLAWETVRDVDRATLGRDDVTPGQRWAALIKEVYAVDPLLCPKCGGRMRIVAFLERRSQPAVVERILKHCGLWEDTAARGPPAATPTQDQLVLESEPSRSFPCSEREMSR